MYEQIAAIREREKLNQVQRLTGIDQSDYARIESGNRYDAFEQCKRIARTLNTGMDYLAELTDEKAPCPRKTEE